MAKSPWAVELERKTRSHGVETCQRMSL